ncbi:MAG: hypothetical protein ACK4UT_02695 [Moraxellaceae bacterium]
MNALPLLALTAWLPVTAVAAPATALPVEELTQSYVGEGLPPCPPGTQAKTPDACLPTPRLTERIVSDAVQRREVPDMPPALSPPTSLPGDTGLTPLQQQIIQDFINLPIQPPP